MARNREPARMRDVLSETGAALGLGDAAATGGIWSRWEEIVGDAIAESAQPTSLRHGVLRVKAASPAWATELTYFAPEIVRRANELAGKDIVREVKVWTGPGGVSRAPEGGDPKPDRSPGHRSDPGGRDGSSAAGREERDPREILESARRAWARKTGRERRS